MTVMTTIWTVTHAVKINGVALFALFDLFALSLFTVAYNTVFRFPKPLTRYCTNVCK